jgi:hypothetical protein
MSGSAHDPLADRLQPSLDGRYRIERELGVGGMAAVYLAEFALGDTGPKRIRYNRSSSGTVAGTIYT